ncbi:MAG: primosomal protein [Proteobacteria bacterium]|nr:primosomal protein [Pseudomonadota bacterium]NBP15880.1 primosomal protein [bacterium]
MALRLIVETPTDLPEFEYIYEEKNNKEQPRLFISGPYMMCETVNKNKRIYSKDDMLKEVARYSKEMVEAKRAMGELNHPESADVNLANACHLVTNLKMEGNFVYGKSQVLSTPSGKIVESLIKDGVSVGMSSRALGELKEENGINRVTNMRLIAIDCVADPSCPKAFVNGILESKQYVLKTNGELEELYNKFENAISNLPKHEVNTFLKEQILSFIRSL